MKKGFIISYIIAALIINGFGLSEFFKESNKLKKVRDQILLELKGVEGEVAAFSQTLHSAHGVGFEGYKHVDSLKDEPLIELNDAGTKYYLKPDPDHHFSMQFAFNTPVKVTVLQNLPQPLTVRNYMCGCESMGLGFIIFGLGIVNVLLIGSNVTFYYSIKWWKRKRADLEEKRALLMAEKDV